MNMTTREKAFKEGKTEGKTEIVLNLLNKKFGTFSDAQLKHFLCKTSMNLLRSLKESLMPERFKKPWAFDEV